MQSLGDNTLAAFLNADSVLLAGIDNKQVKVNPNAPTNSITTNSKFYNEDSDIGKYFKDSISSFSLPTISNSKNKLNHNKSALDVAVAQEKSKNHEEKENDSDEDLLNRSPELTNRSRIYFQRKLNKKKLDLSSENAVAIAETAAKKSRKNAEPLQQMQITTNISATHPSLNCSPQDNCQLNDDQINIQNETDVFRSPKIYMDNEFSSKSGITSFVKSAVDIPSIIATQDRVKLAYWGLPLTILRKYESRGVSCMFPWQVECLRNPRIVEKYQNLVYSAPTSAGKTLVSEILVIKTVLERRKKVIFVLPFVSVVREKMYYFQDLLMDSGVRVEGFMGGIHPPGGFSATDVAIATIEKANSLINQLMEDNELENVGAVVIDELHLLGDPHRGYLLELLLTKLKYMNLKEEHVHVQLIGMSAPLPNLSLLANWLDAELYKTDFRPVPLQEQCKIGTTIYDDKLNILRHLQPHPELPNDPDNVLQLCFETICDGHSVLIFCPTKNWCENLAQQIASAFFQLGREDTIAGRTLRDQLSREAILETLEQLKRTPVGLDSVLRNTVSFGVAYHHAGLTMDERDVIEGAFRSGSLRVLTATSTLSSGVNLPARRVIVRTPIFHGRPIDTLTYKQMIGRAGRMGKDTAGESILVCKPTEKSTATNILNSTLQPIESCLEGSSPLIRALLEAIASEVAYTHDDIATYMKCTLLSFTNAANKVEVSTKDAVQFLVRNELLLSQTTEAGVHRWVATPLGKACLAASVPPKDGLFLFEELQKARQCFVLDTELHVIYLVTPFNSGSQIGQIDWYVFLDVWKGISESERRVGKLVGVKESYIMSALRGAPKSSTILDIHKRFYTALALHDLVREVPLHTVCNKYACCRGVIQSLQQTAATFAGMVTQFCKKLGWNCVELLVSQFQARLQFGVCRELLDLLRLPMLNGLRARSLYREGITSVAELAMANELDVERALHKALPFESEKKKVDEDEDERDRRNKMRSVFVTGKNGLTPRMAASMLVKEARVLVQNELGLEELSWNKQDRSKQERQEEEPHLVSAESTAISHPDADDASNSRRLASVHISQRYDSNNITTTNVRGTAHPSSINSNDMTTGKVCREIIQTIKTSVKSEVDVVAEENLGCNGDVRIDDNNIHIMESVKEFSNKLSELCGVSPESSPSRRSKEKRSYSRSPSLFDDSLIVDTQEFDILEQNVIDIDSQMFNDTVFSEPNSPLVNAQTNAERSKSKVQTDVMEFHMSAQLINTNRSMVWAEDTWNNSKIAQDIAKKIQPPIADPVGNIQTDVKDLRTPPFCRTKSVEVTSSAKSRLEKLSRATKRIFSTPDVVKSPIASLVTFETARRLSTGSNKSEEDVVIETQTIDSISNAIKTRTRMKLESLRSRTLRFAGRTQFSPEVREKNSISTDLMTPIVSRETKPIINEDNDRKLNCAMVLSDSHPENIVKNSCVNVPRRNKIGESEEKKTTLKTRELKGKPKKSETYRKSVPKELSIVNISLNKIKFNEFKRKVNSKKVIALALGCAIFSTDSTAIGTKIIDGGTCYHDVKKKPRKIENGIQNDKRVSGAAIFWGRTVYYLSFENVQESEGVSVKERMALLMNLLTKSELDVRCFAVKETYKTLYKCCGLTPCCTFLDPSTADWLLNPESSEKSFNALVNEHLPEGLTLLQQLKVSFGNCGPGMDVRSPVKSEVRACTESILTWYLSRSLSNKLEALDPILLKTFHDVEMGAVSILSRMELTGMGVSLAALQELSDVIRQQLSTLENKAFALAGRKFNFASTKNVAQILGLDKGKKICTNKAALDQCDHPISNMVSNWRKLSATHTKMVCPLLSLAERSPRIYSNCVMNTATGRVSMHEPNLQNIPRDFNSADNSFVISVRMAFVPAPGNALISADYCQLELRILAHFSKEPKLCSVLQKPGDVFKNIAARWYNTSESEIDDTMRQRTKQLCYGMIYGMGVKTLAGTLKVDEAEAREFLDTFMGAYPGIKKWMSETVELARERGFIETLMKRRRMLPGLNSEIGGEKGQAERQAINTTIQGSAADIAKIAMINIDDRIKREYPNMPMVLPNAPVKRKLRRNSESLPRGAYLVLQLHDELLYEVNAQDLNRIVKIIKESMEQAYSLEVPLPVRIKSGPAWGDLTEYNFDTVNG